MRYARQGGGLTDAERAARERIRLQAVERFEGGEKNSESATALRVSERSVERWRRHWREGGQAGVRSNGSPGRPRLSDRQAALNPDYPLYPSTHDPLPWGKPRHLAGDDGILSEQIGGALTEAGWTSVTIIRGRREPDESESAPEVIRSTSLHIGADALRWAQWTLADEPFLLGGLPVAWQVSTRATPSATAVWNAYFTTGVPQEALTDFLLALDTRPEPTVDFSGPESVLNGLTEQGWARDIDHPEPTATDPGFTTSFALCVLPSLIQDSALQAEQVGWPA
ncbi:DUF317 domain-containing protein [Streptomyces sp. NPDC001584]|uniref:DUF317 domain-containing protein n=1 Tax=Streptomyces sp. NPDC001584 TaxID=3154521 RepID=UPI00332C41FC